MFSEALVLLPVYKLPLFISQNNYYAVLDYFILTVQCMFKFFITQSEVGEELKKQYQEVKLTVLKHCIINYNYAYRCCIISILSVKVF